MRWPWVSRERFEEMVHLAGQARSDLSELRLTRERELHEIRVAAEAAVARHAAEVKTMHAMYERIIETQAAAQRAAIEHAMNLVNFGMGKRVEAVVEEREPDAVTRAARQIQEDTIGRATEALKHQYAEIGVIITDEELRSEAITLVSGGRWKPPAALAPFLKD